MPVIHDNTHNGGDLNATFKQFIIIFAPLLLLLVAIVLTHFYTNRLLEHVTQEADETLNVDLASKVVVDKLRNVVTDLTFLTSLNELQNLLDKSDNGKQRTRLAMELLAFSRNKGTYDQLRFMSTEGDEIVRINYNNGAAQIVPQSQLQNKSDRYYFKDAIALSKGGIYFSPFDLNIEKGVIEQPYKPVIRFATPLFDSQGRKKGLLTLNYLGGGLIQSFKQAAANISEHISLVNASGYWLSNPSPENEWGFMLAHNKSLPTSYPDIWKEIQQNEYGQFRNKDGLITYTTIYPAESIINISAVNSDEMSLWKAGIPGDQARSWKIISHIPVNRNIDAVDFFSRHFLLYGSVWLILLVISIFLARASVRHHLIVAQNEYEQRFRKTLENIDLAAITMDMDGCIIFCNDYLLGITGWTRAEVIGHNYLDIFVPGDNHAKAREFFSALASNDSFSSHFEVRIKTKDGHEHLIAWNNTLSYDPSGKVVALTCIGQDITEQRENEQQLRKLSSAVAQSPNPIMITDTKPRIEYVNPAFTQLTGYSAEEAIGRSPNILKSGETSKDEYHKLWNAISNGEDWNGLFHNRKKDGELYWEYASISPIRDANGETTNYLAVKEDVTKLKQLENQVKTSNRELASTQSLAAMGRMASMIAHDLRNPLSSVKMTLQILGKRAAEDWQKEADELKAIALDQVRYMEDILTDLLQFSRPDALKPEWVSVNKILDLSISTTEKSIQEYGAKLVTDYASQLPTVHGDATKLRQIFSNLIMNALNATDDINCVPEIHISSSMQLDKSEPKIIITICDNGSGIEQAQVDKLFEPFYTTRAKGTGLGLSIVKRLVDQHHGNITLSSVESGGTCATVMLPTSPIEQ